MPKGNPHLDFAGIFKGNPPLGISYNRLPTEYDRHQEKAFRLLFLWTQWLAGEVTASKRSMRACSSKLCKASAYICELLNISTSSNKKHLGFLLIDINLRSQVNIGQQPYIMNLLDCAPSGNDQTELLSAVTLQNQHVDGTKVARIQGGSYILVALSAVSSPRPRQISMCQTGR